MEILAAAGAEGMWERRSLRFPRKSGIPVSVFWGFPISVISAALTPWRENAGKAWLWLAACVELLRYH